MASQGYCKTKRSFTPIEVIVADERGQPFRTPFLKLLVIPIWFARSERFRINPNTWELSEIFSPLCFHESLFCVECYTAALADPGCAS